MTGTVSTEFRDLIDTLKTHMGSIILYGAGAYGEKTYNMLISVGHTITAFCDASPAKVGSLYMSKPIISIQQLAQMTDYIVIISVMQQHHMSICESLVEMGVSNIYAVSLPQLKISQLMSMLPAEHLVADVNEVQLTISAYNKLHNEKSRKNFIDWLYFSLTNDETIFDDVDAKGSTMLCVPLMCPDLVNVICSHNNIVNGAMTLDIASGNLILQGAVE